MKKIFFFLLLIMPATGFTQVFRVGSFADTPPGPFMILTPPSLSLAPNFAGTQGTSSSYSATWNQWTASADTVTAPTGFVISGDNVTFVSSLIFNTPGSTGAITLYVALAAGNSAGAYSGNFSHQSGATVTLLPVSGTTNGVPFLSVSPSSLTLTDTVGTSGFAQMLTATFGFLTGSVNVTIPNAPVPLEMSQDGGVTWASSLSFNTGSPKPILARVTSSASAGAIADTIAFASTGVSTVKIPVGGTVSNPSGVHIDTLVIPTASVTSKLTNFPIVFNETKTAFKTVANGGSVSNANAFDMTFSRDAAGTSLLTWEMETFDGSAGQVVAHILTDSLSTVKNDTIYIRYHQSGISSFQGGSPGAVWDANNYVVAHMNQQLTASGQTVNDYTSNGNNLTSNGTWTTAQQVSGPVGFALKALNANADYFSFPTVGYSGDFTVEGWFNITVASNASFSFGHNSFANDCNWFNPGGGGFYRAFTGGSDAIVDGTATPTNTWTHLVITRAGTLVTAYHNGVSTATANPSAFTFNFSRLFQNLSTVSADISADEIRISNIARSTGWVGAEYLNMATPDTFYNYKPGH